MIALVALFPNFSYVKDWNYCVKEEEIALFTYPGSPLSRYQVDTDRYNYKYGEDVERNHL